MMSAPEDADLFIESFASAPERIEQVTYFTPLVDIIETGDEFLGHFVELLVPERFRGCLDRGVFFAPSAFEAGFTSTAHENADIEETIERARDALRAALERKRFSAAYLDVTTPERTSPSLRVVSNSSLRPSRTSCTAWRSSSVSCARSVARSCRRASSPRRPDGRLRTRPATVPRTAAAGRP